MPDIKCPYCEEELYINHDDGYGYEEDKTFEQDCSLCGRTFTYTTTYKFHYNVSNQEDTMKGKPKGKPKGPKGC
jgi:transposase-like protein